MKVPELKAPAKERGLRRYSKLRKAELIALIQEGNPPPAPRTRIQDLLDLYLPHLQDPPRHLHLLLGLDQDNRNY